MKIELEKANQEIHAESELHEHVCPTLIPTPAQHGSADEKTTKGFQIDADQNLVDKISTRTNFIDHIKIIENF